MATRAANAAMERKSKEEIARKDRASRERIARNEHAIANYRAKTDRAVGAANATGNVAKGISALAGAFNHPEWYKKFGSDQYTANIPNFFRVGLEGIKNFLSTASDGSNAPGGMQKTQPGIISINYLPTLPNQDYATYKQSPINVGLSRFMAELRKMNSRIGDYDASDFGLYWYAAVDVMWLIERGRIAVQTYNTYHIDNAYFAKGLLAALGFDPDDFFAHIAEYKYYISKCIKIFNSSIVVPKNLTFALRRIWMARTIVKDHKGSNAQLYVFRQMKFFYLDEEEDDLRAHTADFTSCQYSMYTAWLNAQIQALTDSVGMQTMMADLRAGIPEGNFLQLDDLNPSETVNISDEEFDLEQIHNLKSLPGDLSNSTLITPCALSSVASLQIHAMADGYIAQGIPNTGRTALNSPGPMFNFNASWTQGLKDGDAIHYKAEFLNFYDEDSDSDDVLEATRLRHDLDIEATDNDIYPLIRGTEVVWYLTVYDLATNGSLYTCNFTTTIVIYPNVSSLTTLQNVFNIISRFDWLPIIKVYTLTYSEERYSFSYYTTFGEVDKVVPLSRANLMNLHEQCSLSLFYIDSNEFNKVR